MSIQNQNPHDGGFVHIFFWLPKSTVELPLSTLKPRNKGCQETREYQIPLYMYSSHMKSEKNIMKGPYLYIHIWRIFITPGFILAGCYFYF